MGVVALIAVVIVLLWFFVSRPRKQMARYQIHKDALEQAQVIVDRYKDESSYSKLPSDLAWTMREYIEDLAYHAANTQFSELGGVELQRLIQDLDVAQAIDQDKVHGEWRQRLRAVLVWKAFGNAKSSHFETTIPLQNSFEDAMSNLDTLKNSTLILEDSMNWEWEPNWMKPKVSRNEISDLIVQIKSKHYTIFQQES